jgi:uncharacterized membrane protein YccC
VTTILAPATEDDATMSDLTRVLAELEEVQEELGRLPDDAVTERLDLHERRARLREEAERIRQLEDGDETLDGLRARLARLEARRDELLARRVSHEPRGTIGPQTTGEYPAETGDTGTDRIHLPHTDQWLLEDRRLEEQITALRRRIEELEVDGPA